MTDNRTRLLLALLRLYEANGRVTRQELVEATGLSYIAVCHNLQKLRDERFIEFGPSRVWGIKPLVEEVVFG